MWKSVNKRVTRNKKKTLGVLKRRLVLSRLGLCWGTQSKYRISEEGRRMGGEGGGPLLYLFKEFSSIFPSLAAPIASLLSPPQTLYLFPALLYALKLHCLFQEVLKRRLQSSTYITLQFVRFARFSAFLQSCVQVLPVETKIKSTSVSNWKKSVQNNDVILPQNLYRVSREPVWVTSQKKRNWTYMTR